MKAEVKNCVSYIYIRLKYCFKKKCHVSFSLTSFVSAKSRFEGANKIYPHTKFYGSMGFGSYIASHCEIAAHIGRFTSIASYVRTSRAVHPYTTPYATTCPMFFSTLGQSGSTFADRMMFDELRNLPIIGNDCWIGENVFFVGGITIGDGAVVLAGAVVTKDVPPYAIVGGIPAKILKYRFDEATIRFLLDFKWWNKDIKWLHQNWKLLCDIEKLKSYQVSSDKCEK